jgi:hypothetical protein
MIRVAYEIQCDTCNDVEHFDAGAITPKQIKDAAKKAGWTRRKGDKNKILDVCKGCTKTLEHAKLRGSAFRSW